MSSWMEENERLVRLIQAKERAKVLRELFEMCLNKGKLRLSTFTEQIRAVEDVIWLLENPSRQVDQPGEFKQEGE